MAAIDNMIEKISDLGLKQDISHEVARMKQQKKIPTLTQRMVMPPNKTYGKMPLKTTADK